MLIFAVYGLIVYLDDFTLINKVKENLHDLLDNVEYSEYIQEKAKKALNKYN